MNRVQEQCPKIDSGTIPSQNRLKIGRVHRVHNPKPARAPRPRAPSACLPCALKPRLPHTPRAPRAPTCPVRLRCACRSPARPLERPAPCRTPQHARPSTLESTPAPAALPVRPSAYCLRASWPCRGLAGHCIAIQSSLAFTLFSQYSSTVLQYNLS